MNVLVLQDENRMFYTEKRRNDDLEKDLQNLLERKIKCPHDILRVENLKGNKITTINNERLIADNAFVLAVNGTTIDAVETEGRINAWNGYDVLNVIGGGTKFIKDGVTLAEIVGQVLYIYINLFGNQSGRAKDLALMEEIANFLNAYFEEEYVGGKYPRTLSYKHNGKSEQYQALIKKHITKDKEEEIARAKEEYEGSVEKIRRLTNDLRVALDRKVKSSKIMVDTQGFLKDAETKWATELQYIVDNPKVKDFVLDNGKFIVFTEELFIYDKNDVKYYGGFYEIHINMKNTEVTFFGNNTHRGYWTGHDPHPHVNGDTGRGCLGNSAQVFAELCSQGEIYALVLSAIDYLENANIDDGAGRTVERWDRVLEDGTRQSQEERIALQEQEHEDEHENEFLCPICDCWEDDEEQTSVYSTVQWIDGVPMADDRITICRDCRGDNFTYVSQLDCYIHNDEVGRVSDYFRERAGE